MCGTVISSKREKRLLAGFRRTNERAVSYSTEPRMLTLTPPSRGLPERLRALPGQRPPLIHPGFRRLSPPVIVIGMHRSGTSLVAGMLSVLGVFIGPRLELPGKEKSPGAT